MVELGSEPSCLTTNHSRTPLPRGLASPLVCTRHFALVGQSLLSIHGELSCVVSPGSINNLLGEG